MQFKVLTKTANGNLVLESEGNKPFTHLMLKKEKKNAAQIFDTIASVEKPLYLAKPLIETKEGDVMKK